MSVACFRCGADVDDGTGIPHRGRLFCSDECCEEFEENYAVDGEPDVDDLETAELLVLDLDLADEDFDADVDGENEDLDLAADDY